uniref:Putative endonuclease 4 n=1 Tax=Anthurium amnicola TaxID=1678845 RepID=A0A1D1YH04_9ARAE
MDEQPETLILDECIRDPGGNRGGGAADESEIGELEAEVKEMAGRIQHLRGTVPGRLSEALSAQLIARRPCLSAGMGPDLQGHGAQVGIGEFRDQEVSEQPGLSNKASCPEADQEMSERLHILRSKISSNIDAMPKILKGINGCITRINRVHGHTASTHCVFKKRRKIYLF